MRGASAALSLALALAVLGCGSAQPEPECVGIADPPGVVVSTIGQADLLLVIDDSISMAEEQAALAAELPRLIAILATGDADQDGDNVDSGDFDAVRDLNVGVITTDMGSAGQPVATCSEPDFGDDGLLRTRGSADAGCAATYPTFLSYQIGLGIEPAAFGSDAACVATAGSHGCGIRQPLEAMLKALTPTSAQPWTSRDFVPVGDPGAPAGLTDPFFRRSSPHGDRENAGFLRERSLLLVVLLSSGDDCSIRDPELFDPDSTRYTEELGLRCSAHPEALQPIERYVNGLLQLRPRPGQLVFAPIVGVPPDLVAARGGAPDWPLLTSPDCETPLRDPRLCAHEDTSSPGGVAPSCEAAGIGAASPPSRILDVARELEARGATVALHSICQASYADATSAIIDAFVPHLFVGCTPLTELHVDADGSVACELTLLLPPGMSCDQPGYAPLLDELGQPSTDGGRAICTVRQLVPESRAPGSPRPSGAGWFYDDFSAEGVRMCGAPGWEVPWIAFGDGPPPSGSVMSLRCTVPGLGAPCSPAGEPDACAALEEGGALSCDPIARSCGVECTDDSECRAAGLLGFVCDPRARGDIDPARFPGDEHAHGFCVDPICA